MRSESNPQPARAVWPLGAQVSLHDLNYVHQVCTSIHWPQRRKVQRDISYWSHPILTAGLVVKCGGSIRAACIAFGHDTVEEGGQSALTLLRAGLPTDVCNAILRLTPPDEDAHLPWRERKARAVDRLYALDDLDIALVSAADKCATLHELNWDAALLGPEQVRCQMKMDGKPVLWYYQEVLTALRNKVPPMMKRIYEMELGQFSLWAEC